RRILHDVRARPRLDVLAPECARESVKLRARPQSLANLREQVEDFRRLGRGHACLFFEPKACALDAFAQKNLDRLADNRLNFLASLPASVVFPLEQLFVIAE